MIPFREWAVPYEHYLREVALSFKLNVNEVWNRAQFNIAVKVQQRRAV